MYFSIPQNKIILSNHNIKRCYTTQISNSNLALSVNLDVASRNVVKSYNKNNAFNKDKADRKCLVYNVYAKLDDGMGLQQILYFPLCLCGDINTKNMSWNIRHLFLKSSLNLKQHHYTYKIVRKYNITIWIHEYSKI